jgi:alpha-galactosidase
MAERGLRAPDAPAESYEPIWCAWGYERDFTVPLMVGTLQKAKELGLEWAVLDDGWQNNEGDWKLDAKKFPGGEADMRGLVSAVKEAGLKARLWITPLAVDPGSDLLHDHTDMLLLDKDGAPQLISWWNSFYLCPAYQPTIEMTRTWIRKIFGEWGYAGHQDRRPAPERRGAVPQPGAQACAARGVGTKSCRTSGRSVYDTAREVNPNAVVELCPCGTSYAFHNMPLHEPGAGVGPAVVMAGAPQGQDAESADGAVGALRRRSRRAERRRRRLSLPASASAPCCRPSSPGRSIPSRRTVSC